jgi:hypothetical protein
MHPIIFISLMEYIIEQCEYKMQQHEEREYFIFSQHINFLTNIIYGS